MGSERGFTFVEVLVVMAVLALGVLGSLQTTLLAGRLDRRSRAVAAATLLAQERVERIAALGWARATAPLGVGPLPGSLGIEGPRAQERVEGAGGSYLLVLEREARQGEVPLCSVRCFWSTAGVFTARDHVRLTLRSGR